MSPSNKIGTFQLDPFSTWQPLGPLRKSNPSIFVPLRNIYGDYAKWLGDLPGEVTSEAQSHLFKL